MIDMDAPETKEWLLRWAWVISLAVLVLGYIIIFFKIAEWFI